MRPREFWEAPDALSPAQVAAALTALEHRVALAPSAESFTPVPRDADLAWLYEHMLSLAERADAESGWGLLGSAATAVDDLIYDRFGPPFSATEFRWHCDALVDDPHRRVSVVAYLTDTALYEGGELQMKAAGDDHAGDTICRRYGPCSAVAFPSRSLEHGVTPVTRGERRSLLLIAGSSGV